MSPFSYERRALNTNNMVGTDVTQITYYNSTDLLSRMTILENLKHNVKHPFIDGKCAEFNDVSVSDDIFNGKFINSVKLRPHRIVAYVPYVKELDTASSDFQSSLIDSINQAIKDVLIEQIFSTCEGDSKKPKGLFAEQESQTINSIEDLEVMSNKVDSNRGSNGVWLCSPSAYKTLCKEYKEYIDNEKLFGAQIMKDSRVEQDYFCYVDLKHIVVGDWTFNSITIDNITQAKDGVNVITIETFVDFKLADEKYISVGNF